MARKPLIQLALADSDLRKALTDHARESTDLAKRFLDQIEQTYELIRNHPQAGSQRYAEQLNMPGLRCWPCHRFPWLIFYLELPEHIHVLRILHKHRDIPAHLQP